MSSHPDVELRWPNSEIVTGDVLARIAEMREQPGGKLVMMGSGDLIRSLLAHDMVDKMLLMIHPVVLGSGRRLFGPDDGVHRFELVDCTAAASGVILASYLAAPVEV